MAAAASSTPPASREEGPKEEEEEEEEEELGPGSEPGCCCWTPVSSTSWCAHGEQGGSRGRLLASKLGLEEEEEAGPAGRDHMTFRPRPQSARIPAFTDHQPSQRVSSVVDTFGGNGKRLRAARSSRRPSQAQFQALERCFKMFGDDKSLIWTG